MKNKTIYLIRHGETALNVNKILQGGGVNSDLNDKGRIQSLKFYEAYKHIPYKKIYTSQLKRSIQSVQQFINDGIPYVSLSELNELHYGVFDGVMKSEGIGSPYPFLVNRWEMGEVDAKLEEGESPKEVADRLKKGWELILSKEEEDIILISMHGRAMRIFLSVIAGEEIKNMQRFSHSNLGLYIIYLDNNKPHFLKFNDTAHL